MVGTLTGEAETFYRLVQEEIMEELACREIENPTAHFIQMLRKEFVGQTKARVEEFRDFRRKKEESLLAYFCRLKELAEDLENQDERLLVRKFVRGLVEELRSVVRNTVYGIGAKAICIVELYGGIGSGLAAALMAGCMVKKWIHVESDPAARKMARHHAQLLLEEYPEELWPEALPKESDVGVHDVRDINEWVLDDCGQINLVVAGWECQGYSRAGEGRGMEDPRGASFKDLKRVLEMIQKKQGEVLYILENRTWQKIGESQQGKRLWRLPNAGQHVKDVQATSQAIQEAGLTCHPKKCSFGNTAVTYLGFQVQGETLGIQQVKVKVLDQVPAPKDRSTLRAVLGFLNYYRRFVPNFSRTAATLNRLLREDQEWQWGEAEQQAIKALLGAVKTATLLVLPNKEDLFTLYTDWSSTGMGAILCQKREGEERVVAFAN
ncbi:unnamed protein product [Closterium sp. NIES-53]